jgi:hypothetical protein
VRLRVDAHSPVPIRWQLAEQLKQVIEGGGVPRDQALPSIRELAGFLGINPNTVARARPHCMLALNQCNSPLAMAGGRMQGQR